jgi:predicted ATPase
MLTAMQSLDAAVRTCETVVTTYGEYSYALIEVPRSTAYDRVHFIIERAGIVTAA